MRTIYEQHEKSFDRVSAYVVLKDGKRVATIAFKFPKDGAGRLYAYVHWIGIEMVRGHAKGYGYDKKSAAFESAVRHLIRDPDSEEAFPLIKALQDVGGSTWDRRLEDAGFTVLQAI